jgi:hypothetical protein
MTETKTAITRLPDAIVNARFGGLDRGIEERPWDAQGGDETFVAVLLDDGHYALRSPNGVNWLSINDAGEIEARTVGDPGQPGINETFSRAGSVLTELPRGLSRPLVRFLARDL